MMYDVSREGLDGRGLLLDCPQTQKCRPNYGLIGFALMVPGHR